MAKWKKVKERLTPNKPTKSYKKDKDHMVLAKEGDKEKLIHYGDPNMKDRPNNKKARKSFRARHKCDEKKSKLTAGYWACRDW